jgi:hypothetical protein
MTPFAIQPRVGHARREHQGSVLERFEGEHAEHGEHVLGADPRVRHVAQVPGAARIAPGDLGPLVPGARPAVGEEEVEQLVGVVAAAEPDQRAQDADLVGGVVVPVDLAAPPLAEAREVLVVAVLERGLGQTRDRVGGW